MFFSYEIRPTYKETGCAKAPVSGLWMVAPWNGKARVSTPWVHGRRLRKPRRSSICKTPCVGTITPEDGR
ncbi:hypothetical protein D3C72_2176650 [compost metagenome]